MKWLRRVGGQGLRRSIRSTSRRRSKGEEEEEAAAVVLVVTRSRRHELFKVIVPCISYFLTEAFTGTDITKGPRLAVPVTRNTTHNDVDTFQSASSPVLFLFWIPALCPFTVPGLARTRSEGTDTLGLISGTYTD